MKRKKLKRLGRISVSVIAVFVLAALLLSLNGFRNTAEAASLKHIDEIVSASGTFNVLEIVPDKEAASFGYYVDGQEPATAWKTAAAAMTTPTARSAYVNTLFSRLAAKGILSNTTTTPLTRSYYDTANASYYTESYYPDDPQNWSSLTLGTAEKGSLTGTMTAATNGAFQGTYAYAQSANGGYVQNISHFGYVASPTYGAGVYYYTPTFSKITNGTDLTGMEGYAIYTMDSAGNYVTAMTVGQKQTLDNFADLGTTAYFYVDAANPGVYVPITVSTNLTAIASNTVYTKDQASGLYTSSITVSQMATVGGFDLSKTYYYVKLANGTGAPGSNNYAAFVSKTDSDDAPGDGYTNGTNSTYFSRSVTSYAAVGTGGNFNYSKTGSTAYVVYFPSVYYHAGYTNNNWFKTQVFGLDSTTLNALGVTVTVRKISEVTAADISAAGLIYISAGTDITKSGVTTAYSAGTDISEAQAVNIYNYAAAAVDPNNSAGTQMPVILDYSIVAGLTQSTPASSLLNIQKLGLLLLQSSFTQNTATTLSNLYTGLNWTLLSYVTNDTDKTLVNNNVYSFKAFNDTTLGGAPNISTLANQLFGESFAQAVYQDGFTAVLTEIQNENFLRTLAGQQNLLTENVSVANAVRHIINFSNRRVSNVKTAIKVLDLEPAKVTSSSWLTPAKVRTWINNTLAESQITVVHMTTGEFVGKIEDLNETYDMIYIGMSTESLNNSGGITKYNDTSMDGLIYSNIGDKFIGNRGLAGIRSMDYMTVDGKKAIDGTNTTNADKHRFSGNDITKTSVTALEKFVYAGYPLVLANGFVSGTAINTDRVDNSSYMYEAVNAVFGSYQNVVALNESGAVADTAAVIKYMNVSKPTLTLSEQPVSYASNANASLTADAKDGHYYLSYTFTIKNVTDPTPISTTYDCNLYIDLNADGRFAANEELGDVVIARVSDNAVVLPLKDAGGMDYYALSADVAYQLRRQMPDEYVGIIPWDLKVTKNGADQIHASQQGFTRIAAGGNAKSIQVLQIMQAGTTTTRINLAAQMAVNNAGTNSQLLGTDGKYYTGIYGKLISDLQDFKVNISMTDTQTLENLGDYTKVLTELDKYNMLIIGFNDCYDGIGANTATAITKYIGTGKSVLFTHDTTSLAQVPYSGYPMATNAAAPTVTTLNTTDVLYDSANYHYKSIDGNVSWTGNYYATCPPNISKKTADYVVVMSSNVTSSSEADYWNAKAGTNQNYQIYSMNGLTQVTTAVTNSTTLDTFKAAHTGSTIIYLYGSAASGWYANNLTSYDVYTTCNYTKFSGGTKYYLSGMTYHAATGTKPLKSSDYTTVSTTSYFPIIRVSYYFTPNNHAVVGTYTSSSNVYTIGGTTLYPATGAAFPQQTLYSRDPSKNYVVSNNFPSVGNWGYYFNTVIRDAVGLDRYGIMNSALKSIVDVNATLTPENITTVLNNSRGVAYTPKSGRASTVPEVQGYTNYALTRFYGSGNTYNYTNNNYSGRETTNVSQVNKGQITTYPYNVNTLAFGGNDSTITGYKGSYMKIGLSHEQYFQINMNTDDIVVWYCLSNYSGLDGNGNVTYNTSSYYDDVPNDCVNAYYIYNKGNVTYSGVGHTYDESKYTGSPVDSQYVNEAKLFVNTMIAAYRGGSQGVTVKIKSDAGGTVDTKQKLLLYDAGAQVNSTSSAVLDENLAATDEKRAIYYRVYNPDTMNKRMSVEYYVSDDVNGVVDTTVDADGNKVSKLSSTAAYNAGDSSAATDIVAGYVYKFYLPNKDGTLSVLDQLKNPNVYSIRFYVKTYATTYKLNSDGVWEVVKSTSSTDYIDLKKQQLFNLT